MQISQKTTGLMGKKELGTQHSKTSSVTRKKKVGT